MRPGLYEVTPFYCDGNYNGVPCFRTTPGDSRVESYIDVGSIVTVIGDDPGDYGFWSYAQVLLGSGRVVSICTRWLREVSL